MAQESLHAALENEIRELAAEVRANSTAGTTPEQGRELLRSALRDRMKTVDISGPPVASSPAAQSANTQPSSVLPPYATEIPKEQQLLVEQLVDVALHQGVATAIATARKANPIVLDILHDVLAGKLYGLMKERGLL